METIFKYFIAVAIFVLLVAGGISSYLTDHSLANMFAFYAVIAAFSIIFSPLVFLVWMVIADQNSDGRR